MLPNVALDDSVRQHCDGMRRHLNAMAEGIAQARRLSAANARAWRQMGDQIRAVSNVTLAYPLYATADRALQVGSYLSDSIHRLWLLDDNLRQMEQVLCGRKPRYRFQQVVVVRNGGHYDGRRGTILTIEFDQEAGGYRYAVLIDAEQYLRTAQIAERDLSLPEAPNGRRSPA